jgi:hypothetical protein
MRKIKINRQGILVILPGLVLTITGFWLGCYVLHFKMSAVKHTAVISYIESSSDAEGELECSVNVTYTVNDRVYSDSLDVCNVDWKTGEQLTIYYDPENPAIFRTSIAYYAGFIAVVFLAVSGAALFLAGGYMLFVKNRES